MQPNDTGFNNRYNQLDQAGTLEAAPDPVATTPVAPVDVHAPKAQKPCCI